MYKLLLVSIEYEFEVREIRKDFFLKAVVPTILELVRKIVICYSSHGIKLFLFFNILFLLLL
ncbi:hypothetical protein LEP1GSC088_2650 [Leptospira interrogans str. L1207]|nr:hypothetical protein LEP1GSC088_2650 [Leptospira interrogans str. L1207]